MRSWKGKALRSAPWACLSVGILLSLFFASWLFRDPLRTSTLAGRKAYDDGRMQDALSAFARGRDAVPDDPDLAFGMGTTLLKMERWDAARAELGKALETFGSAGSPRCLYNLGNAFLGAGADREAADAYRESLLLDSDQEDARRNLELALDRLKGPNSPPPAPKPGGGGRAPDGSGGTAGGSLTRGQALQLLEVFSGREPAFRKKKRVPPSRPPDGEKDY